MPYISEMTDEEIFNKLGAMGVLCSVEGFKEDALEAGTPTALANHWVDMYGARERQDDFLYEAAFELWKRHLGHIKCPEMLAEFIDETINTYTEGTEEHNSIFLLNIYERIKEFYHNLLNEEGSPDIDLYNELSWEAYNDFEGFLLNLPHDLAQHGLIDEAVNIGRWFAGLSSHPENFMRDTGCILAAAGRKEETLVQVEENLRSYPSDIWIVINAGDAMYSLGEIKSSEEFFLKARDMANDKYDKLGVLERLADLYRETGRTERAEVFEKEYKTVLNSPEAEA